MTELKQEIVDKQAVLEIGIVLKPSFLFELTPLPASSPKKITHSKSRKWIASILVFGFFFGSLPGCGWAKSETCDQTAREYQNAPPFSEKNHEFKILMENSLREKYEIIHPVQHPTECERLAPTERA